MKVKDLKSPRGDDHHLGGDYSNKEMMIIMQSKRVLNDRPLGGRLLGTSTLYDNESWNDPRDFAKPVKAISWPQNVPITSDRRLIELENQVQRLMEAHLAPKSSVQVNKIASSCEICSGPHDTQYCMENPE
ncbi:hypothetical protein Tco_0027098 [Tanacetum coccineum]